MLIRRRTPRLIVHGVILHKNQIRFPLIARVYPRAALDRHFKLLRGHFHQVHGIDPRFG